MKIIEFLNEGDVVGFPTQDRKRDVQMDRLRARSSYYNDDGSPTDDHPDLRKPEPHLKLVPIKEEEMSTHDMAMGMFAMQNSQVALVGGMRSGNSRAGFTRLKFMVYDLRGVEGQLQGDEWDEREAGFVELFVKNGTKEVEGLVNIEFPPAKRKGGVGRVAIQSLKDTFGELRVYDIQKKAIPFWRKMGATFYGDSHFTKPLKKTTGVRTGLYAII